MRCVLCFGMFEVGGLLIRVGIKLQLHFTRMRKYVKVEFGLLFL